MKKIIALFVLVSMCEEILAYGADSCSEYLADPCGKSQEWRKNSALQPLILKNKKFHEISVNKQNEFVNLVKQARENHSLSAELAAMVDPNDLAQSDRCIASATVVVLTRNDENVARANCSPQQWAAIENHTRGGTSLPGDNQKWMLPYAVKLRSELASELDNFYKDTVEELKTGLKNILKSKNADPKFAKVIDKIQYFSDYTFSEKYYDRMTYNMGDGKVYVVPGFVWDEATLYKQVWTLAHEVSHSMDPCDLTSIAKIMNVPQNTLDRQAFLRDHPLRSELTEAFTSISDNKTLPQSGGLCAVRNYNEAFADRIAAMIFGDVLTKQLTKRNIKLSKETQRLALASIGSRICKKNPREEELPDHYRYPKSERRLRYLFESENFRQLFRCGAGDDTDVKRDEDSTSNQPAE